MQAEFVPWVVAGRIAAVIGMGLAGSLGILFLLGAYWLWGVTALGVAALFFGMMMLVERSQAAQSMSGKPPAALEP